MRCFYLVLPGAFANMAPVLVKKINFLDYPVDFGKKWRGQPLFGSHKTFRGFFFGIIFSIIVVYIQTVLFTKYGLFQKMSIIEYPSYNFVLVGFLMGFGVLLGDLVESFLKRRAGIKPGQSWKPWDQLDSAIGGILLTAIVYIPPVSVIIFLLVLVPTLHIIINHIGYYLKLRKSKW